MTFEPDDDSLDDFLKTVETRLEVRAGKKTSERSLNTSLVRSSGSIVSSWESGGTETQWLSLRETSTYRVFCQVSDDVLEELQCITGDPRLISKPNNRYFNVPYCEDWRIDVSGPFWLATPKSAGLLLRRPNTGYSLKALRGITPGMRKRKLRKRREAFADYLD